MEEIPATDVEEVSKRIYQENVLDKSFSGKAEELALQVEALCQVRDTVQESIVSSGRTGWRVDQLIAGGKHACNHRLDIVEAHLRNPGAATVCEEGPRTDRLAVRSCDQLSLKGAS